MKTLDNALNRLDRDLVNYKKELLQLSKKLASDPDNKMILQQLVETKECIDCVNQQKLIISLNYLNKLNVHEILNGTGT